MRVLRLTAALAVAAVALLSAGAVRADEGAPDGMSIHGFIVGLRQSVSDTGRRALGEAAGALARLELGAGIGRELRPGLGLTAFNSEPRATLPVGSAFASRTPAVEGETGATGAPMPTQKRLSLLDVADGTVVSASDRSWSLGRTRANLGAEMGTTATDPAMYLTGNLNRGPSTGAALAEHAYEGRDIELGLPLPLLPNMRAAVAHYWWGERAFTPTVDGYRFSLRYDLNKTLQFEGGESQDSLHGSAGFFGIRYTKSLGTERPEGVMPR